VTAKAEFPEDSPFWREGAASSCIWFSKDSESVNVSDWSLVRGGIIEVEFVDKGWLACILLLIGQVVYTVLDAYFKFYCLTNT
jgi:hypothetical protein